jgi:repressor LexA
MDLTKRQQEIFDFIKRYSAKYGYPPTVRDIGKAVGLASSSTVHAHLANLDCVSGSLISRSTIARLMASSALW